MKKFGMHDIIVSAITVSYNCENVIEQNIQSCLGISGLEHIVIDNNSTDSTAKIIAKYVSQVEIIQNTENFGFTKANNQGIEIARGKYIFLLNPDAYLFPETVSVLTYYLEQDKKIGAVAPVLVFPDSTIQNYTRRFPRPFGLFVESFVPKRFWFRFKAYRTYTYADLDFTGDHEVEQPAGAAIMFRNTFLLDETYFIYGSDVDLCKTIIDNGYRIIQTPSAKVGHYQSQGGTDSGNSLLRVYLDLDNYFGMQYYFKKWGQIKGLYAYRMLFFVGLSLSVFFSIFTGSLNHKFTRLIAFFKSKNFRHFESKR